MIFPLNLHSVYPLETPPGWGYAEDIPPSRILGIDHLGWSGELQDAQGTMAADDNFIGSTPISPEEPPSCSLHGCDLLGAL